MPAFLIPLLRNWKALAAVGLVVGAFLTGWKVNGWRLEENYAEERMAAVREAQEELARLYEAQKAAYEDALDERDLVADRLQRSLIAMREHAHELRAEVESVRLSKPEPTEGAESEVSCDSNPFSDNFVRLWNDAADIGAALPGAPPAP